MSQLHFPFCVCMFVLAHMRRSLSLWCNRQKIWANTDAVAFVTPWVPRWPQWHGNIWTKRCGGSCFAPKPTLERQVGRFVHVRLSLTPQLIWLGISVSVGGDWVKCVAWCFRQLCDILRGKGFLCTGECDALLPSSQLRKHWRNPLCVVSFMSSLKVKLLSLVLQTQLEIKAALIPVSSF